jgi:hypothetical protein
MFTHAQRPSPAHRFDSFHWSDSCSAVSSTLARPYQSRGPMYTMNQIGTQEATRKYQ